jgi:hypothetical protein
VELGVGKSASKLCKNRCIHRLIDGELSNQNILLPINKVLVILEPRRRLKVLSLEIEIGL